MYFDKGFYLHFHLHVDTYIDLISILWMDLHRSVLIILHETYIEKEAKKKQKTKLYTYTDGIVLYDNIPIFLSYFLFLLYLWTDTL